LISARGIRAAGGLLTPQTMKIKKKEDKNIRRGRDLEMRNQYQSRLCKHSLSGCAELPAKSRWAGIMDGGGPGGNKFRIRDTYTHNL
jgi:hypothetical protein